MDTRNAKFLLNALMALAIGALLGALSVVPYDEVLGLAGSTSAILQSAISVTLFGALNLGRVAGLKYEPKPAPKRTSVPVFLCRHPARATGTQTAPQAS